MPASAVELTRLSVLAAVLIFNYAIVRAGIDSTFLEVVGKEGLPWAWLGVASTTLFATAGFDFAARRLSLPRLFVLFSLGCAAVLAALLLVQGSLRSHGVLYALYIWKDVHIVLLLEILWGRANTTIPKNTARWAYGLFCAAGSIGGIAGGWFTATQAEHFGTDALVWMPVVVLLGLAALGGLLFRGLTGPLRKSKALSATDSGKDVPDRNGLAVLRASRMLPWLLAMVLLAQVTITLIDYLYNGYMQETFTDRDQRTAMMGMVNAGIDGSALVLQLLSGLMLMSIGVGRTLVLVPMLLGLGVAASAVWPVFVLMGGVKIASKAMDYSIFRTAKEILYIPLSYPEQTQGKGLVDVLSYRTAKAGAAAIVLVLAGLGSWVWAAVLAVIALWLAASVVATARHNED